jgi:hypothetical protein
MVAQRQGRRGFGFWLKGQRERLPFGKDRIQVLIDEAGQRHM